MKAIENIKNKINERPMIKKGLKIVKFICDLFAYGFTIFTILALAVSCNPRKQESSINAKPVLMEEKPYQKAIINADEDLTITFNYLMSYQAFNMYYDYVLTQWPNDFGTDRTTTNPFHYKNAYSLHSLISHWGDPNSSQYTTDYFSVGFRQFANINFLGQSCQLYRLYFYTSLSPTTTTTASIRFTWYKINPYTPVEGEHNYFIYGFAQYYDNGWTNYPNIGSYTDNYLNCPQTTSSQGYDLNLANLFRPFDYDNTDLTNAYNNGYNNGYSEGYDEGYDLSLGFYEDGYDVGYRVGSQETYQTAYDEGHFDGYQTAYPIGYNAGYDAGESAGYSQSMLEGDNSPFTLLQTAFASIGGILNIEILPNLTLGLLIFVPLIVAVIIVIVKMIRG